MKCAVELAVIHGIAFEEKEKERREEIERRRQAVVANTIERCETLVNDALIKSANKGDGKVEAFFPIRFNEDEFIFLSKEISNRGRVYYTGYYGWCNWNAFREYLAQHCLACEWRWDNYPCCNGGDFIHGATLRVFIDEADCLA